jgi:hypothetical protein
MDYHDAERTTDSVPSKDLAIFGNGSVLCRNNQHAVALRKVLLCGCFWKELLGRTAEIPSSLAPGASNGDGFSHDFATPVTLIYLGVRRQNGEENICLYYKRVHWETQEELLGKDRTCHREIATCNIIFRTCREYPYDSFGLGTFKKWVRVCRQSAKAK